MSTGRGFWYRLPWWASPADRRAWRLPADRSSIHSPPQPGIWPASVIGACTVIDVRMGHKTNPDNRIVTVVFGPPDHRPMSVLKRQVSTYPRHYGALNLPASLGPRNSICCRHRNLFPHECDYGESATNRQAALCRPLPTGRIRRRAPPLISWTFVRRPPMERSRVIAAPRSWGRTRRHQSRRGAGGPRSPRAGTHIPPPYRRDERLIEGADGTAGRAEHWISEPADGRWPTVPSCPRVR